MFFFFPQLFQLFFHNFFFCSFLLQIIFFLGEGTSLWRNMKIQFTVSGTFDWETLEISLTKQHIGRYTNAVNYSGVILPDRCAIEGHYQNGSISLRKVDGKF